MRTIRALFVLSILMTGGAASAQTRFEDLPGYDRYKNLRDNMSSLVVGGTIENVHWSKDGLSLSFTRSGKRYVCDLAAKTVAEGSGKDADSSDDAPPKRGQRRPCGS